MLPTSILSLTFTRAAAQELLERVKNAIGENEVPPRVSTLHSFALRQLVRNGNRLTFLPQPLRIADDWEEENVVLPDLQDLLKLHKDDVKGLLGRLAADWETLRADEAGWETTFPDPKFIGAWQRHRQIYGYTLRSELVYQLKKALEQIDDFEFEAPFEHLIVDEYQDLNRCDIAVIEAMRLLESELFIAGDDDQSIYGFRNAHPLGIREFPANTGAVDLRLEICRRCDKQIIDLASWVISQEVGREEKTLAPEDNRPDGTVALWRFANQHREAEGIAERCAELVANGTPPQEILILLRSDPKAVFSTPIVDALHEKELPVHLNLGTEGPFDSNGGRQFLSLLRLVVSPHDSLAWRALLKIDSNSLGNGAARSVENCASNLPEGTFWAALAANEASDQLASFSGRARTWAARVAKMVTDLGQYFDTSAIVPDDRHSTLLNRIAEMGCPEGIESQAEFEKARDEATRIATAVAASELAEILRSIGVTLEDEEPVVSDEHINILTMHKAKGLGKRVVFIVGAEDERIPGANRTDMQVDEERRLLYVSLTRARNELYVTYCSRREEQQRFYGSVTGQTGRTLTRFLRDGPITPERR